MLWLLGLTYFLSSLKDLQPGRVLSCISNVVGCGTHVRIQAPLVDENAFVNSKAFHKAFFTKQNYSFSLKHKFHIHNLFKL